MKRRTGKESENGFYSRRLILNTKYLLLRERSAFTLIELLITIALTAVVAVTGFLVLGGFNAGRNLKSEGEQLTAALQNARQNSLSQQNGARWGVHLSNATSTQGYVVFSGLSYASGTAASTHTLRGPIQFGNPSASSTIDIIFGPITGYLSSPRVLTLNDGRGDGLVYDISINALGRAATKSDTGLVGYWHLDEGTSTVAYDASGMGNNGTLYSSPAWVSNSNCKAGACLSFNGTSDYVRSSSFAGQPVGNAPRTITAWIKPNAGYTGANVITFWGRDDGLPYGYGVYLNSAYHLIAEFDSSNGIVTGNQVIASNAWSYITAVYNGSTNAVYVNGVLDNSVSYSSANAKSGEIDIGQWSTGCCRFSGLIDEVRVYNRALSAQEILDQYNALQ